MKTFLNSFWNFAFCLKFHIQQFSPQWKFQKLLFPPSFFLPPWFWKISVPPRVRSPSRGGREPLCRSTEFKDILPRNISQMITKTYPITIRILTSCETKKGHSLLCLKESEWKLRLQHNHCKTTVEQILASEEINKSKRAGLSESQSLYW